MNILRFQTRLAGAVALAILAGCGSQGPNTSGKEVSVSQAVFGKTPEGETVDVFTLVNAHGMEVRAITYGGIIISLRVPDRTGRFDDVALGFDDLEGYVKNPPYFGAIIGRYGNRIAKGQFILDGTTY